MSTYILELDIIPRKERFMFFFELIKHPRRFSVWFWSVSVTIHYTRSTTETVNTCSNCDFVKRNVSTCTVLHVTIYIEEFCMLESI